MKKSRQIKRKTKTFINKFNTTFTKAIALTIAFVLLTFSLLLTVAKGQETLSGDEMSKDVSDIIQKKNSPRNNDKAIFETLTNQKNDSVLGNMFAPSAGEVDLSFNPTLTNYVGSIRTSVLQPDGKLLVGGFFISINGIIKYNLARFNIDGSLDATFTPKVSDGVYSITIQSDGKILITGIFTFVNGFSRNRIARLNTDGTLDTTFNPGGGADNAVYTTAIQSDGKIVVGGFFTLFNGNARNNLVRLNFDGSVDASFANTLDNSGFVWKLQAQTDGKILVAGNYFIGGSLVNFSRFNSNGTRDTIYTANPNSAVRDFAVQPDGKILIGGSFITVNGTSRNRIARLNVDGTLDTTFNPGTGASSVVWGITLLASGKMLVGGEFVTFNGISRNRITQLNSDGTLDTTFNPGTGFNLGAVYSIKILPSGQLGVGGFFTQYNGVNRDIGVVLDTDGTLDLTFALATLFQASIRTVLTQYDGKIIVGGSFNRINGQIRSNIARLNADGTLDMSFNIGSGANGLVYKMIFENDGKIVIAGSFTTYNGISRNRIARLNSDGTLDTTFDPGTGANAFVSNVIFDFTGGYIICGSFTSINGISRPGIAKLNSNGSLNSTFNPSAVPSSFFEGIGIQGDGKIVAGGQFSFSTYNSLVRFNTNGSIDNTFAPVTLPNTGIYSLAIQDDDKILIGGTFSGIGSSSQKNIARLNVNGSLDTSFNVGSGTSAGDDIEDIVVLANGKVLIGGLINSVNGTPRNNLARLNADGSLDTTFTSSADNIVWDIEVPIDTLFGNSKKMFAGGDFFSVNDLPRSGLAGLFIEPRRNETRFDFDGDGKTDYGVFRPSNSVWYLQNSASGFSSAQFGLPNDKLVPADYDGDGKTDIAIYRDGIWYMLRSKLGFLAIQFGSANDIPVPADKSGDGVSELIVFRPSQGVWYELDFVSGMVKVIQWGQNGDIPISDDDYSFSGGDTAIVVFRPSNGVWYILDEDNTPTYIQWGQNGDIPVAADYDGDGESDVAVYRNGVWYILQSSNGQARIEQFGLAGDKPVVGDYDGDGKADLAVWRPSNSVFYVLKSNGNQLSAFQWGLSSDLPIASIYAP